jgi:hypothetical protein
MSFGEFEQIREKCPWRAGNQCLLVRSDAGPSSCSNTTCLPYIIELDHSKEMGALRSRLHNTEVALVAMWALIKDSVSIHAAESVEQMMEEYFYHQESLGAFSGDHFFTSTDDTNEVSYELVSDEIGFETLKERTSNLSIIEANEMKTILEDKYGYTDIRIRAMSQYGDES